LLTFPIHHLSFLFLVLALFLPRIALLISYLQNELLPFHLTGLLPPIFWLILPRVLVLYIIYLDQGISGWFWLHIVALVIAYSGGGTYASRRRRRAVY
jgi:hypothetical protein